MLQDVSVTDFRRGFEKASRFKADPVFDADKRFCGSYTGDCLGQIKQHPRDAAEVVRSEQGLNGDQGKVPHACQSKGYAVFTGECGLMHLGIALRDPRVWDALFEKF